MKLFIAPFCLLLLLIAIPLALRLHNKKQPITARIILITLALLLLTADIVIFIYQ